MNQHAAVAVRRSALIAAVAVLIAGCGGGNSGAPTTTSVATTASPARPPVAVDALDGLLLSPAEIGTAMASDAEVPVKNMLTQMADTSAGKPDKNCRFTQPAESTIYANSGWKAVRSQELQEPVPNFAHHVIQAVVLFPDAGAASFFKASAQFWPLCANHEYHVLSPGGPDKIFTMGPIDNTNGILSTTDTLQDGNGWACQRALTASNNVVVDVAACATNPAAGAAVNIARQIADKVAKL